MNANAQCVQRLGNSLRAADYLGHAINVLKEDGKADASAVDVLLWRVMGNCWPLPCEPEYSPIDTNLARMESPPSAVSTPLQHDPAPCHSGLVMLSQVIYFFVSYFDVWSWGKYAESLFPYNGFMTCINSHGWFSHGLICLYGPHVQARDFCTTEVWKPADGVLNMYKFSLVRHRRTAILFGGMYVASGQNTGNCSNSIIRFNLDTREHEHIKTQGLGLFA